MAIAHRPSTISTGDFPFPFATCDFQSPLPISLPLPIADCPIADEHVM